MDNSAWAPRPALIGLAWVSCALLTAGALYLGGTGDRAGPLLFGVAAAGVGAFAAHGTLLRPRLRADRAGITVRTLHGTQRHRWTRVRPQLVTTRRLGRDMVTLELQCDHDGSDAEALYVFGWLELGTDPRDVSDTLTRLGGREPRDEVR